MYRLGNTKISGKKLVLFILFFTVLMETLIAEIHFPEFIRYLNDIALIMLIPISGDKIHKNFSDKKRYILYAIGIFMLICLASAFIRGTKIQLVVWATRNTFRGLLYFIYVCCYLTIDDVKEILDKMYIIQYINLTLALYQFFVLKHSMDCIGGVFGYGNGAGVNIFNALMVAYYLNAYLNKKARLRKLIVSLSSALLIAAIAEEKITFVFICMIFIISILLNKFNKKIASATIVGIIGLSGGLLLLKFYYPNMIDKLININLAISYLQTTYSSGYMIPRVGAFTVISKMFFKDSILLNLLGIGFGNGETSKLSFLQSDFYNQYGKLNYRWFVSQWTFIETGYLGVFFFVLIFIIMLILIGYLYYIKRKTQDSWILVVTLCMVVCAIISIWYNSTLKSDMSYMAYFGMAIGFVMSKKIEDK